MRKIIPVLLVLLLVNAGLQAQAFDPRQLLQQARERARALRAARLDALRQLGETIKGIHLDSHTVVRDFVTVSDEIQARFEGLVQGAYQQGPAKVYDDGTVLVKMVLPWELVVKGLQQIARTGDAAVSSKLQNLAKRPLRLLQAYGSGAMRCKPAPAPRDDLWRYINARGKLMARRAAQMDAYRNMGETVYGLRLDAHTTVKDFVASNDAIRAAFSNIVRGVQFDRRVIYRPEGLVEVHASLNVNLLANFLRQAGQPANVIARLQAHFPSGVITVTGLGVPPARFVRSQPRYPSIASPSEYQRVPGPAPQPPVSPPVEPQPPVKPQPPVSPPVEPQPPVSPPVEPQPPVKPRPQISAPPMPPVMSIDPFDKPALPPLPKVPERFVPEWAQRYITVTGSGVYPEDKPAAQARALAQRAAQVDAYRLLAERALGIKIDSQTTVKDFVTTRDQIKAKIEHAFVRGAQIIGRRDLPDQGCFEVDMKLYLGDMWEIIDAQYNQMRLQKYGQQLQAQRPDAARYTQAMAQYQKKLENYQQLCQAYEKQLAAYYAKYEQVFAQDDEWVRQYREQYQTYRQKTQQGWQQYRQYKQDLANYQARLQDYLKQYDQYYAAYRRQMQAYQKEAAVAAMPEAPQPPRLNISLPNLGGIPSLPKPPERVVPKWAQRYITATGTGVYPQGKPVGQARAMAKRAAQVDAYRLLVENAMGVHLDSHTTVKDFLTERDQVKARVYDCFLRGAQTVAARDFRDKRYFEVDMKLYLGDMWEIIDAEYNKVLMSKYGKTLEQYQPDQQRYRQQFQRYQSYLADYKKRYLAYQQKLRAYYQRYQDLLTSPYPLAKKYHRTYQEYLNKTKEYDQQYTQYQQRLQQYRAEQQRRQAAYQQLYQQYQQRLRTYQAQAAAALVPPPPMPPSLHFTPPAGSSSALPKPPERFVPKWAQRYITATGTGSYPPGKPLGQAKLMAKRAAQVDAYRQLVETAMGVHLRSQTAVKDFLTKRDKITAKVKKSFLRGARVVAVRYVPEDRYCEVDMKLYLGDMWEIIDAEYNKVLLAKYGKTLEQYQPDQARYRTELELYQSQLRTYHAKLQAYQAQLREYHHKYGQQLAQPYPITRKYNAQYQQYLQKAQQYAQAYEQYQRALERYAQQQQQRQQEYRRYRAEYQKRYATYAQEANK